MSAVAVAPQRASLSRRLVTSAPVALLWLLFAVANFQNWRETHVPLGLGATALELVIAGLFVVRRDAITTSRAPLAWVAAIVGTFGMLGARPQYAPLGGLEPLYLALQVAGAVLGGWAVATLGRSFGLVAANRGIRTGGPYRFVRHPLYSGFLTAVLGTALVSRTGDALIGFAIILVAYLIKIRREESLLTREFGDEYARFRREVPMLVPWSTARSAGEAA